MRYMDNKYENENDNGDSFPEAISSLIKDRLTVRQLEIEMNDRINTENDVRRFKRLCKACPFEQGGICGNISIRCGERQQYSVPESRMERRLPHRCNYQPKISVEQLKILIVDDDSLIREMCTDFLKVGGFNIEQVNTATGTEEAEDAFKVAKIKNAPYHLVISDIRMGGASGYHLVNHIVERNINTRILLISAFTEGKDAPANYLGNAEVLPGKRVVNRFIRKPILLADFNTAVKEAVSEMLVS